VFIIRELTTDDPAVNLRILKYRDFAAGCIYGLVLGFGLYGGIFILPVYLQELRGFSASQAGWIIFPGGMATALTLPITGRLGQKLAPRTMVAVGTIGFIVSMWILHFITLDTSSDQLFWPLVLRGASMGFLFLPLTLASLTSLVGKEIGAGTGLFNLFRQLGGSAGIAFLSTYLDHRTDLHRSILVQHINPYNPTAMQWLHKTSQGFMAKGYSITTAKQAALAAMDRLIEAQALVMSYQDAFLIIGIVFVCALPLLLLFRKRGPVGAGGPPVH